MFRMKKIVNFTLVSICFGLISLFTISLQAQTKTTYKGQPVYSNPDVFPEFPGGKQAMNSYLEMKTIRPQKSIDEKVTGIVNVEFIVTIYGKVVEAKVTKGIGAGCDEEALRVVLAMPQWSTGTKGSEKVHVRLSVPVKFGVK